MAEALTLDEFFSGYPASRLIFEALQALVEAAGPSTLRVTKSQVSWRQRRAFAWAWVPARYLHGQTAPLVLSLVLPAPDPSPRWKQIVEPYPGKFMHHVELFAVTDLDEQVRQWVQTAWLNAASEVPGRKPPPAPAALPDPGQPTH